MADFQSKLAEFGQNDIAVFALSTDSEEHAREVVDQHGLAFPVLYGIDGRATSAAWGSYYEERRGILHATGFVLFPDHRIASATYSTGPVGRLTAQDALGHIAFQKKKMAGG